MTVTALRLPIFTELASRPVARRSVGHWRWCLDYHTDKGATVMPDYCQLCWNSDSNGRPWRTLGFVQPGAVA